VGTQAAPGTAASGVGRAPDPTAVNANSRFNVNSPSQTPFFADPGVQQQLRMNNNQFNQLNRAYQQALQRYNRNIATLDTAGGANSAATGSTNRATRDALRRQQLSRNDGATATNQTRTNNRTANRATANRGDFAENQTIPAPNATNSQQTRGEGTNAAGGENPLGGFQASQFSEFQTQFNNDLNNAVGATFTDPAMRQRFNQLNWQYQGLGAFNDPMIQQQLSLTADQQQRLVTLNAQWRQQLQALQTQNRGDLTPEEFAALRSRFMNQLDTVLTPEQQQQWTAMIGDTYDFPFTAYVNSRSGSGGQTRSGNFGNRARVVTPPTNGQPGLEPHSPSTARGTSNTRGPGTRSTR